MAGTRRLTSAMYLKIAGEPLLAADPRQIRAGLSRGLLTVVPHSDDYVAWRRHHVRDRKRIFVCRSLTLALHPLLSCAAGFIFRGGSPLHHLANILRTHGIPALIDPALWTQAKRLCAQRLHPIQAELCCGETRIYSAEARRAYAGLLRRHCRKLETNPVLVTVHDCRNTPSRRRQRRNTWHYGLKAMAINALACEGFAVPDTLLLGHFDALVGDVTFTGPLAAVQEKFPEFGRDPELQLMVRMSAYSSRRSPGMKSHSVQTCAVRSPAQLAHVLRRFAARRDTTPTTPLSVVIQRRIPTAIQGVFFTRLPWDYRARQMACDLKLLPIRGSTYSLHLTLPLRQRGEGFPECIAQDVAEQLPHRLRPSLDRGLFVQACACFVDQCLELQKRYYVPLDIEFAVTADMHFYFTQFRHVFNVL